MRAIQDYGVAQQKDTDENLRIIKHNAETSEHRRKIQQGMVLVAETLTEFQRIAQEDKAKLKEYVHGASGKGSVLKAMSDKTRMSLACTLGKTLSAIAKDNYTITSDEFITQDELSLVIYRLVEMTWGRFISDKIKRKEWLEEVSVIFNELRGVNNAGTGAESEVVENISRREKKRSIKAECREDSQFQSGEAAEEVQETPAPKPQVAAIPWEE